MKIPIQDLTREKRIEVYNGLSDAAGTNNRDI